MLPYFCSIKINITLLCVLITLCATPVVALIMIWFGLQLIEYTYIPTQIFSYLETRPFSFFSVHTSSTEHNVLHMAWFSINVGWIQKFTKSRCMEFLTPHVGNHVPKLIDK